MNKNEVLQEEFYNPSLQRLQEEYKAMEKKFEGIKKNWNKHIRNYMTKTIGLHLNKKNGLEDEKEVQSVSIPIYIKPAHDKSFFEVIEDEYPELDFSEYFTLKQYLHYSAMAIPYFHESQALERLRMNRAYAHYRMKAFDLLKITDSIFKVIKPKETDIFGTYDFDKSEIEIYVFPIVLFTQLHGLDLESFIVTILTHELAHAYTHQGRDKDMYYWIDFPHTDNYLTEGLAQYYTYDFTQEYKDKRPLLKKTFEYTLNYQPDEYTEFQTWQASPEQVYRALIEVRRNEYIAFEDFRDALEDAENTI